LEVSSLEVWGLEPSVLCNWLASSVCTLRILTVRPSIVVRIRSGS
jgi:hypothetical protein